MTGDTMTASLARVLRRAGWAPRDPQGTGAVAVLEWGGTPPAARVIILTGGAVLAELDAAGTARALTSWEVVTPDNLDRVTRYIQEVQQ